MQEDLKAVIAMALKTTTLDCCDWPDHVQQELAKHIIAEVQRAGYQFYEYNPRR